MDNKKNKLNAKESSDLQAIEANRKISMNSITGYKERDLEPSRKRIMR